MINEQTVLNFVDNYRNKASQKLANPYVFGVLAVWLAYRGKMGTISRTLLGVAGAVTLYQNYKSIQSANENASALDMIADYASKASNQTTPAELELSDSTDFPPSELSASSSADTGEVIGVRKWVDA